MNKTDINVELIDYMGSDRAIEQAARVSFHTNLDEERTEKQTTQLLRYLMWHRHTSPFEMAELKFKITVPMYIGEQILRHRTASINKISRRYSNEDISFFDFELRRADDSTTKQGSGEVIDKDSELYDFVVASHYDQKKVYDTLIESGVANEVARGVLGANLMTTFVWKIDLHNLMHFLKLRLNQHAQKEIQEVASMIYQIVKPLFPITIQAFDDWRMLSDEFMDVFYQFFKTGNTADGMMELHRVETDYR